MLKTLTAKSPANRLFGSPPPRVGQQVEKSVESSPSEIGESVTLTKAAKAAPTSPSNKESSFFSGGIAKTAMAVGLMASLSMGMMGCTTMQTTCSPTHCVTQEVIDPVGTAAAVGATAAGIIILDAVIDGGQQYNNGYYNGYQDGAYQGYHGHHHGGYGYGGYYNQGGYLY